MAAPCQYAGHTFSHYRILESIGAGGMGVVYRAHDDRLNRDADISGLDRTYIGGIERGERNVSLVNIERIAKALKISIPTLFKRV
jgi:serine/threonine protein kinase